MHNQNRALHDFIRQKLIKASAEAHFKCIQFTIFTFNDSRSLSNLLMLILRSSCKSTWGYFFVKLLKFFIHGQGPDWIELGKSTKLKLDKLLEPHWPCCVLLQELLAYIVVYLLINILYRELLVKRSECGEEEASCREVRRCAHCSLINIDMHNILTSLQAHTPYFLLEAPTPTI